METTSAPKVSVIMACFNAEPYISDAVKSVIAQQYSDLELIVVDDRSTDGSLRVATEAAQQDPRVKVVALEGRCGPAVARNKGVEVARGEWIAILDADDIALPARLSIQMAAAKLHGDAVMITGASAHIDEFGRVRSLHGYPTDSRTLCNRLRRHGAFPPHSSVVYRADCLRAVGCFNPRFLSAEDWDAWLRVSEKGQIIGVSDRVVLVRKHDRNVSDAFGGRLQMQFAVCATVSHYLKSLGYDDPGVDYEEEEWRAYAEWIDAWLERESYYHQQRFWADGRATYAATGGGGLSLLRFAAYIGRSRLGLRCLMAKLCGAPRAKRLAWEWVKYRRNSKRAS